MKDFIIFRIMQMVKSCFEVDMVFVKELDRFFFIICFFMIVVLSLRIGQ